MHTDHDIKGVFRYQHYDRPPAKGLPGLPGPTKYIPFQFIIGVTVTKDNGIVVLYMAGGNEHWLHQERTKERFFEEYSAYQDAHERGL
jgi:hypothetical protein